MSGLLVILCIVLPGYLFYRRLQQVTQLHYIQNFTFHSGIRQKLKNKHSTLSEQQLELVLQGLRDYFHICHQAKGHLVAMPSQVVDDAWHEFILSTRSYDAFCRKALGRFLHHTPAEAMRTPTQAQEGIKRAWRLACTKEKINPQQAHRLPLLFALDTQLHIPHGFRYNLDCQGARNNGYCASDIGCSSGCVSGDSSSDSSDSSDSGSDSGCSGGGCGGGGD